MAESTLITGQFVRISQTPASIGERLIALVIDYILLGIYVFSTFDLFSRIHLPSDFAMLFFLAIVYLPVIGPSIGKRNHRSRYEPMLGVEPSAFTTRMFIIRLPKLCP